jgi:hypothetical protein
MFSAVRTVHAAGGLAEPVFTHNSHANRTSPGGPPPILVHRVRYMANLPTGSVRIDR